MAIKLSEHMTTRYRTTHSLGLDGACLYIVMIVLFLISSDVVLGEPPDPATRSAALDELNSAVGVWDSEAICRFTPNGNEVATKGVRTVRWSANKQFLISDERLLMPGGWLSKLVITTWDPIKKEYRLTNVLSNATYVSTMTFDGTIAKVWGEMRENGHVTQTWATIEQVSDGESKFRCECSIDDGPKWLFSHGTSKKRNGS